MFKTIKGQERVIKLLKEEISHNRVGSGYIFHGPSGVGKFSTALLFGMALNCYAVSEKRPCGICNSCHKFIHFSHPDFLYTFPIPRFEINTDGTIKDSSSLAEYERYVENRKKTPWQEFFFSGNTEIRIDSIRLIQERVYIRPYEAKYKIFLIEDVDKLNLNASNAFLKTLEEPPLDTVILMTTSKYDFVLPTITSRCQKVQFHKISYHTIENILISKGADSITAKLYARIADGNVERALRLMESESFLSRDKSKELLDIIVKADDLKFMSFIENYKSTKVKSEFIDLLNYLLLWLTDIHNYVYNKGIVINVDYEFFLSEVVQTSPEFLNAIPDLVIFLEDMLRKVNQNVNPQLVGSHIYNRISRFFEK